jgi:hypothetical protein
MQKSIETGAHPNPRQKIDEFCEQAIPNGYKRQMFTLPGGKFMVIKINAQNDDQEGIFAFDGNGNLVEFSPEDMNTFVDRTRLEYKAALIRVSTMKKEGHA